jgi:urease accessory protein
MLAGAGLGASGVGLPMVEAGIAASVVALGLMILGRVELPVAAGVALVAVFALFHGHAHGAEATGAIPAYMAGFALTTAGLHVAGIALGRLIAGYSHAPRIVGGAIAAAGAYLVASL